VVVCDEDANRGGTGMLGHFGAQFRKLAQARRAQTYKP
jgi:hypothetical protein